MKWKIGDLVIDNRVVIGPMAGISNSAFREIAANFKAGLVYTEMISDKAICYSNKKTIEMTKIGDEEGILNMQLFGNEIESLVIAAKYLDQHTKCQIIDINMGCPVPKIVNSGSGSALMKNVAHVYNMTKSIVENVNKPVTAKIRAGWDTNSINAVEVAIALEKAGVKAIAVHGRTRSQFYEGQADWEIIKQVKQAVKVPVIGNGDLKSVDDVKRMLEFTGCDAYMLARGVLGNPWLIKECVNFENGNLESPTISYQEKFEMAKQHARKLIELRGENLAMKEMRGHACWYIFGLPGNNAIKQKFNNMTTYQQYEEILSEYSKKLEELELK